MGGSVVVALLRKTGCRHVRIPDCLDFFDALVPGPLIKHGKHPVEQGDHFLGSHLPAYLREADDIGKKNRDVRILPRYGTVRVRRKFFRNFFRQDIQEQVFRPVLFCFKFSRALLHGIFKLPVFFFNMDKLSF